MLGLGSLLVFFFILWLTKDEPYVPNKQRAHNRMTRAHLKIVKKNLTKI